MYFLAQIDGKIIKFQVIKYWKFRPKKGLGPPVLYCKLIKIFWPIRLDTQPSGCKGYPRAPLFTINSPVLLCQHPLPQIHY